MLFKSMGEVLFCKLDETIELNFKLTIIVFSYELHSGA